MAANVITPPLLWYMLSLIFIHIIILVCLTWSYKRKTDMSKSSNRTKYKVCADRNVSQQQQGMWKPTVCKLHGSIDYCLCSVCTDYLWSFSTFWQACSIHILFPDEVFHRTGLYQAVIVINKHITHKTVEQWDYSAMQVKRIYELLNLNTFYVFCVHFSPLLVSACFLLFIFITCASIQ